MIASPVRTLARDERRGGDVAEVASEVRARRAVEVVVGLPLSLDGGEGPAAQRALAYAERVSAAVAPVPVRLVDERLSTVDAHRALHAAGRRERDFRAVVDQVAAVVLLQAALDVERTSGHPPGRVVGERARPPRKPRHRGGGTGPATGTTSSSSTATDAREGEDT